MSEKRILKMVPPNDPRLLSKIAPYQDDMLKDFDLTLIKIINEDYYEKIWWFRFVL